jgi:insulysin
LGNYLYYVLYGAPRTEEAIEAFEKITYKQFLEFKEKFLKQLKFQWLISGHLDQSKAEKICQIVKESIKYSHFSEDDVFIFNLALKFDNKTVCNLEEANPSPENKVPNPNSAIMCYFQDGEKTYERSALLGVLFQLLKEPCFNTLRTNE